MTRKMLALVLALILIVSIPISAYAVTPRIVTIDYGLSYSGTTAICTVTVVGNNMSEEIKATVKLWYGSTCLYTWTETDYGYLDFEETLSVTSGKTYKMTVDVTVDGTVYATRSTSRTCPLTTP